MAKYINPNEEQKKAIEIDKNAVVAAGAGSGKTSVLAARFVHLVEEKKYNVDEILTLTFTKKATTEMSSRIYNYLQQKCPEQAANFYKANIKTLDGYCTSVAKEGAHFFGISPEFQQDEKTLYNKIYQKALPFILEHRDNLAIKSFVTSNNYEEVAQQLFVNPIYKNSKIASPINFREQFHNQTEEIFNLCKKTIASVKENLTALNYAYENFDGNMNSAFLTKIKEAIIDKPLPSVPDFSIEDIESANYEEIKNYTAQVQSIAGISQKGTKPNHEALKDALNQLREDTTNLITVVHFTYGFQFLNQLLPLLEEFQQIITEIKRSNSILTFDDIANLAVQTLVQFPEIRNQEKQKFKSIMIDEFQDNNSLQRDLLFLLAEKLDRTEKSIPTAQELVPNKLFFVGDEKQSIYKFRGADVSVFRSLTEEFPEGQILMSNNFRSHPALIAAFNTFFGGTTYPLQNKKEQNQPSVFYKQSDVATTEIPKYEAVYRDAIIPENKYPKNKAEFAPRVHFANYLKGQAVESNMLEETAAEITWITKKIKSMIDEGINPSSIAVLLRTYDLQPDFERAFLSYGIPYVTGNVTGFFSDGPVNDIVSYLKICVYEKDTISYAEVLRSPFVNLSLEDASKIILQNKKPFDADTTQIFSENDADAKQRYLNACDFFEKFNAQLKNISIANAVTTLWYDAGYRYETIWNQTVEMYSKMYDFIFELARKSDNDNQTISEFIDGIEVYRKDSTRLEDMDIPLELTNGVNILSIHKSKGLEYDTVFIPNANASSKSISNSALTYYDKFYGLTVNTPLCPDFASTKTNYFFDSAKELEYKMKCAELRRVTYVALTRAKNEIYISNGKYLKEADAATKYTPSGTTLPKSIFHILEPVINYYIDNEDISDFAPFDVIEIPPQKRMSYTSNNDDSEDTDKKLIRNNVENKIKLINKLNNDGCYEKTEVIETVPPVKSHISPSKLHPDDDDTNNGNSTSSQITSNNSVPYHEINEIVASTIPESQRNSDKPNPRFGFTDFGTLVHFYMEQTVNNDHSPIPKNYFTGLENMPHKIDVILEICKKMSTSFLSSEIGKKVMDSSVWTKTEYPFKSRVCGKIINGIMDLIFQDKDGEYYIVDYKTNQTIEPEIYYNQLACYRQAISQIFNIEHPENINCYLFYLRFGQAVNITEECNKVNLDEVIQNLE